LQEKEIVRVGGNQQIKVDFRCIAATNKNLETLVKNGTFRPDLYYRLHVFCIDLPPLRDRREDIPLLVNHFLNKFCMATSRAVPTISNEAMDVLMRHDWPGNVRELENAVERALVIGRGSEVRPNDFSFQFQGDEPKGGRTLDDIERVHIERILRETQHNLSRAARILDIDRTTLYNKLRRYGLGETHPPHPARERAHGPGLRGAGAARLLACPHFSYAVPDPAGHLRPFVRPGRGPESVLLDVYPSASGARGRPGRAQPRRNGLRSLCAGADVCLRRSSTGRQLRRSLDGAALR
jgi:ActR/RegA family two-component response regulator